MSQSDKEQNLKETLVKLGQTWQVETQDAYGHLTSKTRHAVGVSDPETRARIQGNLDHAVGLLCVAHAMTLFEKGFPSEFWPKYLEDSEVQILKAYRHLRRCAANGFVGDRVDEDREDFDAVMTSDQRFQGVDKFDENTLRLTERITSEVMPFLQMATNKALVATYQHNEQSSP